MIQLIVISLCLIIPAVVLIILYLVLNNKQKMATLEEREIVDYTMKKLEKVLGPDNFMIKDLDKMHHRLDKQERRFRKINEKIENLENKDRCLERENIFEKSSSERSE